MTARSHQPWIVKSRRRVFAGGPIREIAVEHVVLPDGRELSDYYAIVLSDFALVFATSEDERALVLRQYKHGLRRTCLAFPGGAIDRHESPLAAARRELLEETGYESEQWRSLGSFVTNSNQGCNAAHLFVAERCRAVSAPKAPDVENPELVLMPIAELLSADRIAEIGLASHAALLALATHPALRV
ncbi:MAG: NUDIX hydrolase [Vicinamibacterales bacterium]